MDQRHLSKHPIQVTTIGGGSGQFALLTGLKDMDDIAVTAIVSMVDSGGSTGRLRNELGILPPGDILKCLLALSRLPEEARSLLLKRFVRHRRLRGHNAGNMLLTMLSSYTGSFPSGVSALAEILEVKGAILPVTTDRATLVAELTDGTHVYGEGAIDIPRGPEREKIQDIFLVPHHSDAIQVYPPVLEAVHGADYLILGPGDLFTSIIPNLVVPGVAEAVRKSKGCLVYIVNIMTKYGETPHFSAPDFVRRIEAILQRRIDIVIYNKQRPPEGLSDLYAQQKSDFVQALDDNPIWLQRRLISENLLESNTHAIRHDPKKLSQLLSTLFKPEGA